MYDKVGRQGNGLRLRYWRHQSPDQTPTSQPSPDPRMGTKATSFSMSQGPKSWAGGISWGWGRLGLPQAMPGDFRQLATREMGQGEGILQFRSGSSSTLTDALQPDACRSPVQMLLKRSPPFPVAFIFKAPPPTQAPEGLPGGDGACTTRTGGSKSPSPSRDPTPIAVSSLHSQVSSEPLRLQPTLLGRSTNSSISVGSFLPESRSLPS